MSTHQVSRNERPAECGEIVLWHNAKAWVTWRQLFFLMSLQTLKKSLQNMLFGWNKVWSCGCDLSQNFTHSKKNTQTSYLSLYLGSKLLTPGFASFIAVQQNFRVSVFPIIRVHITWHKQGLGSSLEIVSTSGLWGLFWENSGFCNVCNTWQQFTNTLAWWL